MVFDLKRITSGFIIVSTILLSYYFKLDIFLITLVSAVIFYDLLYSKFIEFDRKLLFYLIYILLVYLFLFNHKFLVPIMIVYVILSLFLKNITKLLFNLLILSFIVYLYVFQTVYINSFYLIIFLSFLNDTTAYIFGSLIKGPKIIPLISPNKTWSGSLISFVLTSLILIYLDFTILNSMSLSVCFFLGDIYFSFIKRKFNLKDFSNIISGHGGILDRVDSIFLPFLLYGFFI